MLDPQVKQYLEEQAVLGLPASGSIPVEEMRAAQVARRKLVVTDFAIPGPAGNIPARAYASPAPKPLPLLVFFHGGGWVTGDLDTTDAACRIVAEWAQCLVVSVNYRHAPEHRFPAAVDDAYAATRWLADNAGSLQGDPSRLAVGGLSAGGNLAAAVTLKARSEGGPPILFQWLAYPVMDANFETPSMLANAEGFGLSQKTMSWYWDQYVPDPAQRLDPLASPLREPDLSGLPPAFVATAEYDPLCDEGEAYARRLQEAGVPVLLKRYDGLIHGFYNNSAEFDQARLALSEAANHLRRALNGSEA